MPDHDADVRLARRALALLDLTELSDACREDHTETLVGKALSPIGHVAAVCVWPQFVSLCHSRLKDKGVKVATVVNFPAGDEDVDRTIDDTKEALRDGADEIDLVLPWRAFQRGDVTLAGEMVAEIRALLEPRHRLKVILESGMLGERPRVTAAAELAIGNGADFIKTSTGKAAVSATPEAVEVMLDVIRASGRSVGIKPSGGIRSLADAGRYLALADRIMGPDWATPATFRFGASGLHDGLVAVLSGGPSAKSSAADY